MKLDHNSDLSIGGIILLAFVAICMAFAGWCFGMMYIILYPFIWIMEKLGILEPALKELEKVRPPDP